MYIFLLTEFSTNIVMQKYYVDKKNSENKLPLQSLRFESKDRLRFRPGSYVQKFTSENWGFIYIIAFNENPSV